MQPNVESALFEASRVAIPKLGQPPNSQFPPYHITELVHYEGSLD